MLAKAKRLAILSLGWTFVVLGILGLFLPILQGILFLCIGLMLLASTWAPAQRLLDRLRHRFPAVAANVDEAERRAKAWLAKLTGRFGGGAAARPGADGGASSDNAAPDRRTGAYRAGLGGRVPARELQADPDRDGV